MVAGVRRSFLSPWVIVSAVLHVAIMLGAASGIGLLPAHGMRDGDGWGGQSIEVEIAGPRDGLAHGAVQPTSDRSLPQPAMPEPADEEPPEDLVEADEGEVPVEVAEATPPPRRPRVEAESERPSAPVEEGQAPVPGTADTDSVDDPSAQAESTPANAERPSGTDGDGTLAGPQAGDVPGLILGSAGVGGGVSPRTALLPNSGVCSDPVAGTWRAQKYRTTDHTWVRFILRIDRAESGALSGSITSRIWTGNRGNPNPGECTAFGMDHTWRMAARGRYDEGNMTFRASGGARLVRQDCPRSDSLYAPDNFSGPVHVMREVFESRNNDGAFDIDEPYTFRRVSCE